MRLMCQSVTLLLLAGCYASHGLAPSADSGVPPIRRDASPPPPPPLRDAGTPLDASVLDCPLARADFTCLSSFLVAPRRAFDLPISFDGCFCCGEAQCAVDVDAASQRIDLTTARCPDDCDCDMCTRGPATGCHVPALEPGTWTVFVNGGEAFELPVDFDSGLVAPPPACVSYAAVDACGEDPSTALRSNVDRLCVRDVYAPGDDLTVELQQSCGGCSDLDGVCAVVLEPRLSAMMPPGGDLHVVGTQFSTRCDVDCPTVCIEHTRRCAVPPLTPGGFYRVWLNDSEVYSFTAGDSPAGCVDLAYDLEL